MRPKSTISIKAFVLVPFAAVFGVFFVAIWRQCPLPPCREAEPDRRRLGVLLVAAAVGGLGFWWFDAKFDELGYAMPGQYPSHQQLTPLPDGRPTFSAPERPDLPGIK